MDREDFRGSSLGVAMRKHLKDGQEFPDQLEERGYQAEGECKVTEV